MNAEAVIRTLKEDYGITSRKELEEAISKMKKLNIGVFVKNPEKERKIKDGRNALTS